MDYKMILLIISLFFSLSFFILLFSKCYKISFYNITLSKITKFCAVILLLLLIGNVSLPYIYEWLWISFAIFYLISVFLEEFLKVTVFKYYKEKEDSDKKTKALPFALFFAFLFWIIESLIYIFVLNKDQILIQYEFFILFRIFINPLAHVYFLLIFVKLYTEKKDFKLALLISFLIHYLFNLIIVVSWNMNLPYLGIITNLVFLGGVMLSIDKFLKENNKWFLKNK